MLLSLVSALADVQILGVSQKCSRISLIIVADKRESSSSAGTVAMPNVDEHIGNAPPLSSVFGPAFSFGFLISPTIDDPF
jgi:hypothetical protein